MKSYFALGIIIALSWVGLVAGVQAQDSGFSGPSLLPLPEAQREYPTTPYPNAPATAYSQGRQTGGSQQFAKYNPGEAQPEGAQAQGEPEVVPTPGGTPDCVAPGGNGYGPSNGHSGSPGTSPSLSDRAGNPYCDAMSTPYGSSVNGSNPYGAGVSGADEAYGLDAGDLCGYGGGTVSGGGGWWGSVGGLIMGRDRGNPYTFSYYDANEAAQFTTQQYNWGGGVQASVGHCFGAGCHGTYGIEAVYWGLYPNVNTQTTLAGAQPGNLNAILNFNQLNYNGGLASLSTENAAAHRLQSQYEIQNVEINLLNFSFGNMTSGSAARLTHNFGAGFRWFRFRDGLQFASDPSDGVFTGAADELYYDINTINDLIGFQLIGQSNYWFTNRLGGSIGTKFGVYNNHIQHTSRIGGAAGDAVINNGPFNGTAWNVAGTTNTVALMGEIDAGLTYALGCHWSLFGGYRVVGVSNVALTTNQIYPDLRGINDVQFINHNGSLILHGAYAGVQFCW